MTGRFVVVLVTALALSLTLLAGASSTDVVRLTSGRCCETGWFSPDGNSVAYLRHRTIAQSLDRAHEPTTEITVCLWAKGQSRDVLCIEPGTMLFEGVPRLVQPDPEVYWLEGGRWLLVVEDAGDPEATGTLCRAADGWKTRVARKGNWSVAKARPNLGAVTSRLIAHYLSYNRHLYKPDDLPNGDDGDLIYKWPDLSSDGKWALGEAYRPIPGTCQCCGAAWPSWVALCDRATWSVTLLTSDNETFADDPRFSPDARHIAYIARSRAESRKTSRPLYQHLRLLAPDGSVRQRLAAGAEHVTEFTWVDSWRIVYTNGRPVKVPRGKEHLYRRDVQQLSVTDIATGSQTGLTAGNFHHRFLDCHGDRFLVAECLPGYGATWADFEADLFVITPRG